MGLREKVALVFLLLVVILQTAPTDCKPQLLKNPFDKYNNKRRNGNSNMNRDFNKLSGKNNGHKETFSTPPIYKTYNFPEVEFPSDKTSKDPFNYYSTGSICPIKASPDSKLDSVLLNNLRKDARRKRKSKQVNRSMLSQKVQDYELSSQPYYVAEIGVFPDVEYPLNAIDTWTPKYWNTMYNSNNNAYVKLKDEMTTNHLNTKGNNGSTYIKPSKIKNNKGIKIAIENKPHSNIIKEGTDANLSNIKNNNITVNYTNNTKLEAKTRKDSRNISLFNPSREQSIQSKPKKHPKSPHAGRQSKMIRKGPSQSVKLRLQSKPTPTEMSNSDNTICSADKKYNSSIANCFMNNTSTAADITTNTSSTIEGKVLDNSFSFSAISNTDNLDQVVLQKSSITDECPSDVICDSPLAHTVTDTIFKDNITHEHLKETNNMEREYLGSAVSLPYEIRNDSSHSIDQIINKGQIFNITTQSKNGNRFDSSTKIAVPIDEKSLLSYASEIIKPSEEYYFTQSSSSSYPETTTDLQNSTLTVNLTDIIQEVTTIFDDIVPKTNYELNISNSDNLTTLHDSSFLNVIDVPSSISTQQKNNANNSNAVTMKNIQDSNELILTSSKNFESPAHYDVIHTHDAIKLREPDVSMLRSNTDRIFPNANENITAESLINPDANKSPDVNVVLESLLVSKDKNKLTDIFPHRSDALLSQLGTLSLSDLRYLAERILSGMDTAPNEYILLDTILSDNLTIDYHTNDTDSENVTKTIIEPDEKDITFHPESLLTDMHIINKYATPEKLANNIQSSDSTLSNEIALSNISVNEHHKPQELFPYHLSESTLEAIELTDPSSIVPEYLVKGQPKTEPESLNNLTGALPYQIIIISSDISENLTEVTNKTKSYLPPILKVSSERTKSSEDSPNDSFSDLFCPLPTFSQCSINDQQESEFPSNNTVIVTTLMEILSGKTENNSKVDNPLDTLITHEPFDVISQTDLLSVQDSKSSSYSRISNEIHDQSNVSPLSNISSSLIDIKTENIIKALTLVEKLADILSANDTLSTLTNLLDMQVKDKTQNSSLGYQLTDLQHNFPESDLSETLLNFRPNNLKYELNTTENEKDTYTIFVNSMPKILGYNSENHTPSVILNSVDKLESNWESNIHDNKMFTNVSNVILTDIISDQETMSFKPNHETSSLIHNNETLSDIANLVTLLGILSHKAEQSVPSETLNDLLPNLPETDTATLPITTVDDTWFYIRNSDEIITDNNTRSDMANYKILDMPHDKVSYTHDNKSIQDNFSLLFTLDNYSLPDENYDDRAFDFKVNDALLDVSDKGTMIKNIIDSIIQYEISDHETLLDESRLKTLSFINMTDIKAIIKTYLSSKVPQKLITLKSESDAGTGSENQTLQNKYEGNKITDIVNNDLLTSTFDNKTLMNMHGDDFLEEMIDNEIGLNKYLPPNVLHIDTLSKMQHNHTQDTDVQQDQVDLDLMPILTHYENQTDYSVSSVHKNETLFNTNYKHGSLTIEKKTDINENYSPSFLSDKKNILNIGVIDTDKKISLEIQDGILLTDTQTYQNDTYLATIMSDCKAIPNKTDDDIPTGIAENKTKLDKYKLPKILYSFSPSEVVYSRTQPNVPKNETLLQIPCQDELTDFDSLKYGVNHNALLNIPKNKNIVGIVDNNLTCNIVNSGNLLDLADTETLSEISVIKIMIEKDQNSPNLLENGTLSDIRDNKTLWKKHEKIKITDNIDNNSPPDTSDNEPDFDKPEDNTYLGTVEKTNILHEYLKSNMYANETLFVILNNRNVTHYAPVNETILDIDSRSGTLNDTIHLDIICDGTLLKVPKNETILDILTSTNTSTSNFSSDITFDELLLVDLLANMSDHKALANVSFQSNIADDDALSTTPNGRLSDIVHNNLALNISDGETLSLLVKVLPLETTECDNSWSSIPKNVSVSDIKDHYIVLCDLLDNDTITIITDNDTSAIETVLGIPDTLAMAYDYIVADMPENKTDVESTSVITMKLDKYVSGNMFGGESLSEIISKTEISDNWTQNDIPENETRTENDASIEKIVIEEYIPSNTSESYSLADSPDIEILSDAFENNDIPLDKTENLTLLHVPGNEILTKKHTALAIVSTGSQSNVLVSDERHNYTLWNLVHNGTNTDAANNDLLLVTFDNDVPSNITNNSALIEIIDNQIILSKNTPPNYFNTKILSELKENFTTVNMSEKEIVTDIDILRVIALDRALANISFECDKTVNSSNNLTLSDMRVNNEICEKESSPDTINAVVLSKIAEKYPVLETPDYETISAIVENNLSSDSLNSEILLDMRNSKTLSVIPDHQTIGKHLTLEDNYTPSSVAKIETSSGLKDIYYTPWNLSENDTTTDLVARGSPSDMVNKEKQSNTPDYDTLSDMPNEQTETGIEKYLPYTLVNYSLSHISDNESPVINIVDDNFQSKTSDDKIITNIIAANDIHSDERLLNANDCMNPGYDLLSEINNNPLLDIANINTLVNISENDSVISSRTLTDKKKHENTLDSDMLLDSRAIPYVPEISSVSAMSDTEALPDVLETELTATDTMSNMSNIFEKLPYLPSSEILLDQLEKLQNITEDAISDSDFFGLTKPLLDIPSTEISTEIPDTETMFNTVVTEVLPAISEINVLSHVLDTEILNINISNTKALPNITEIDALCDIAVNDIQLNLTNNSILPDITSTEVLPYQNTDTLLNLSDIDDLPPMFLTDAISNILETNTLLQMLNTEELPDISDTDTQLRVLYPDTPDISTMEVLPDKYESYTLPIISDVEQLSPKSETNVISRLSNPVNLRKSSGIIGSFSDVFEADAISDISDTNDQLRIPIIDTYADIQNTQQLPDLYNTVNSLDIPDDEKLSSIFETDPFFHTAVLSTITDTKILPFVTESDTISDNNNPDKILLDTLSTDTLPDKYNTELSLNMHNTNTLPIVPESEVLPNKANNNTLPDIDIDIITLPNYSITGDTANVSETETLLNISYTETLSKESKAVDKQDITDAVILLNMPNTKTLPNNFETGVTPNIPDATLLLNMRKTELLPSESKTVNITDISEDVALLNMPELVALPKDYITGDIPNIPDTESLLNMRNTETLPNETRTIDKQNVTDVVTLLNMPSTETLPKNFETGVTPNLPDANLLLNMRYTDLLPSESKTGNITDISDDVALLKMPEVVTLPIDSITGDIANIPDTESLLSIRNTKTLPNETRTVNKQDITDAVALLNMFNNVTSSSEYDINDIVDIPDAELLLNMSNIEILPFESETGDIVDISDAGTLLNMTDTEAVKQDITDAVALLNMFNNVTSSSEYDISDIVDIPDAELLLNMSNIEILPNVSETVDIANISDAGTLLNMTDTEDVIQDITDAVTLLNMFNNVTSSSEYDISDIADIPDAELLLNMSNIEILPFESETGDIADISDAGTLLNMTDTEAVKQDITDAVTLLNMFNNVTSSSKYDINDIADIPDADLLLNMSNIEILPFESETGDIVDISDAGTLLNMTDTEAVKQDITDAVALLNMFNNVTSSSEYDISDIVDIPDAELLLNMSNIEILPNVSETVDIANISDAGTLLNMTDTEDVIQDITDAVTLLNMFNNVTSSSEYDISDIADIPDAELLLNMSNIEILPFESETGDIADISDAGTLLNMTDTEAVKQDITDAVTLLNMFNNVTSSSKYDINDIADIPDADLLLNMSNIEILPFESETGDIVDISDAGTLLNMTDTEAVKQDITDAVTLLNMFNNVTSSSEYDINDIADIPDAELFLNMSNIEILPFESETGDIVDISDAGTLPNMIDTEVLSDISESGNIVDMADTVELLNITDTEELPNLFETGAISDISESDTEPNVPNTQLIIETPITEFQSGFLDTPKHHNALSYLVNSDISKPPNVVELANPDDKSLTKLSDPET